MLKKFYSKKFKSLLDLIRFNKPIGFALLVWPCWLALSILENSMLELLNWYLIFLIGGFLMRSAGCIINDIIDMNIDKKIYRTKSRPLASGELRIIEAVFFLIILLFLSFLILLNFNFNTIILGILSVPLITLYPLMKRFTFWPQAFLGLIFSWGVLIVAIQFENTLSIHFLLLYIACFFWTLAYDTIYAYQDIEDDKKNNIRSTAVLFREFGKLWVITFYSVFLIIIGSIGYIKSESVISLFVIFIFLVIWIYIINKWDVKSRKSSNFFFRINNLFGLLCFSYLNVF